MSTTSFKHKNGRPTQKGQLEIQRELKPYFEKGICASFTSEKTGINIKTVCKYFKFWVQEISEAEDNNDFLENQKQVRTRTLVSLDNQILDAYNFLDKIDEEIKKTKEQNKPLMPLFSFRLGVMRHIATLTKEKGSFSMHPTMKEALEMKSENDKKNGDTGTGI